jgi:hypothetical protein
MPAQAGLLIAERVNDEHGLPRVEPLRFDHGAGRSVDQLVSERSVAIAREAEQVAQRCALPVDSLVIHPASVGPQDSRTFPSTAIDTRSSRNPRTVTSFSRASPRRLLILTPRQC